MRDIYRYGDLRVPVPVALADYVRGPSHMAELLGLVCKRLGEHSRQQNDRDALLAVLRYAEQGMNNARFINAMLAVFPIGACKECRNPFLSDLRHVYCSEQCFRRHWNTHSHRAPKETSHA